ncbi:hypothetical protein BC828DRAFT_385976 [Blastocladiella britannica]|nr:hypothetical protein BC828DRAFT_385976 [Blastocladiella britannica]
MISNVHEDDDRYLSASFASTVPVTVTSVADDLLSSSSAAAHVGSRSTSALPASNGGNGSSSSRRTWSKPPPPASHFPRSASASFIASAAAATSIPSDLSAIQDAIASHGHGDDTVSHEDASIAHTDDQVDDDELVVVSEDHDAVEDDTSVTSLAAAMTAPPLTEAPTISAISASAMDRLRSMVSSARTSLAAARSSSGSVGALVVSETVGEDERPSAESEVVDEGPGPGTASMLSSFLATSNHDNTTTIASMTIASDDVGTSVPTTSAMGSSSAPLIATTPGGASPLVRHEDASNVTDWTDRPSLQRSASFVSISEHTPSHAAARSTRSSVAASSSSQSPAVSSSSRQSSAVHSPGLLVIQASSSDHHPSGQQQSQSSSRATSSASRTHRSSRSSTSARSSTALSASSGKGSRTASLASASAAGSFDSYHSTSVRIVAAPPAAPPSSITTIPGAIAIPTAVTAKPSPQSAPPDVSSGVPGSFPPRVKAALATSIPTQNARAEAVAPPAAAPTAPDDDDDGDNSIVTAELHAAIAQATAQARRSHAWARVPAVSGSTRDQRSTTVDPVVAVAASRRGDPRGVKVPDRTDQKNRHNHPPQVPAALLERVRLNMLMHDMSLMAV